MADNPMDGDEKKENKALKFMQIYFLSCSTMAYNCTKTGIVLSKDFDVREEQIKVILRMIRYSDDPVNRLFIEIV